VLNKESLGKVGIKVTLDKVPGAAQPSAGLATQAPLLVPDRCTTDRW
jgi:hypothetical protein